MQFKNSKADHKVISTIRFIAMCSVVWGHCSLGSEAREFNHTSDAVFQTIIMELGRLGTVMFFVLSGFLMQPQLSSYTIRKFFKERFKSTLLPWMLFILAFAALQLYNNEVLRATVIHGGALHLVVNIIALLKANVFYFAYWFIVVFVISALLLIVFKKYINAPWFGISLALITLFYCVNLHYGWVATHHTKAFLGYAFFMWLGTQMRQHYSRYVAIIHSISWRMFAGVFIITFALACYEAVGLKNSGCADAYASIRFTNIIASLIAFCCLYKAGSITWVHQSGLRHSIYGVYLLHSILIYQFDFISTPYFQNIHIVRSELSFLNAQIILFIAIMGMSVLLVKAFKQTSVNLMPWFNKISFEYTILDIWHKSRISLFKYSQQSTLFFVYKSMRLAGKIIIPFAGCFYLVSKLMHFK
jgi:hypothetical protein